MRHSHSHRGLTVGVLFAAIAQILWPAQALAQSLPSGVLGSVNTNAPTTVGSTMTVNVMAPRAIINWNTFNVGNGAVFQANGPGNFILLNRVLGGSPSAIDGLVQSSGNVWIVNNAGIAVSGTGRFDVAGLLLSTADVTDADFMDGNASFNMSGTSTAGISIGAGASLKANTGGNFVLADRITSAGTLQAAGTNALLGAQRMTVTFDANLGAITTLDLGTGSTQTNAVSVTGGAAFTGTRNLLMAAGMTTGRGNVLLSNPGGANDIRFNAGTVELISRDANVVAQGVFTTPSHLTVDAGQMFQGNGGPTVGGNYSITGQDFSGGVFNPVFIGTNNSLSITDTQGSLPVGGLSAPGDINITVLNGGLTAGTIFGGLISTNGNITLTSGAGDITISNNVTTATTGGRSVTLNSSFGITQSGGVITTNALFGSAATGISLAGANLFAAGTFTNSATGGIAARSGTSGVLFQSATTSSGDVTLTGTNGLRLADSNLSTDNGSVAVNGNAVVTGTNTVSATGGNATFSGTIDGGGTPGNLTVSSAGGAIFNGAIGASSRLGAFNVSGPSTFTNGTVRTTNGIQLNGEVSALSGVLTLDSVGAVSVQGALTAAGGVAVTGASINMGNVLSADPAGVVSFNTPGNLSFTGGTASTFQFGVNGNVNVSGAMTADQLTGSVTGTTTMLGDNAIGSLVNFDVRNGLQLRNVGSLSVTGNLSSLGDIRLDVTGGDIEIANGNIQGRDVILSANNFYNRNAPGNSAIDATGHWVIYQQAPPTTPQYGGLDSGQTAIWGQTLATLAPSSIAGNRYVFAFRPTLTFTTTNTTKTYGTDLTGLAGTLFTTTGYQPGVAGAYLGDTAASVFSGAPLVTSAGFSDRASVAGGPYAIAIANGSLTSLSGYQFTFNGGGNVTVNPKDLTGTATTTTKTYDGSANGTGTISLSGVVAGDTVGATGTFTFFDKNAGVNKTVTLTGVTLNGTDAGNYTLAIPATTVGDILQKAITGTGTVVTKTYDGNANGTGAIALSGVLVGDDVGATGTFTYFDKNAGTNKTVTLSGVTLGGADAGNYTLTVPSTLLGDILQKAITGTVTVVTKTYDGNADGTGTVTLGGVVGGDDVTGKATFTFSDKNAGAGKTVTISGASLSGADAGNYTVTLPASALGEILRKAITGTPVVTTKTYDGTTDGSGTIGLAGVVAGDDINASGTFTYTDKNAGTGKTVTVSSIGLGGADAGNYTLTIPATVLGDILQKVIGGTAVVTTKTYDGTTDASGTIALSGIVVGDDVGASATFTFADKNAGAGKTVTVSGVALGGADAGNYVVNVPSTTLGEILRKAITGTTTITTKTYDGNTTGSGTIELNGAIVGDAVVAGGTFTFADKNAGSGKLVTVSGVTLTGVDAGNYTISVPAAAVGDILQKAITGTATVTTKTYDGTRAGTGVIGLNGVIGGDVVGATGTYTFSDANAGAGKTVVVSGVALNGADAGNYTVVVSGATVADILRRSITVTADPLAKSEGSADPVLTYGVTQGSLVAGDTLSGNLSRDSGEAPGTYAVGQGTLSATSNYQLTFVGSTLTITPVATDPTPSVAVTDDLGGVVRFLDDGLTSTGEGDPLLEIVDERTPCDPAIPHSTACRVGVPE